jgi:hypothetical protein
MTPPATPELHEALWQFFIATMHEWQAPTAEAKRQCSEAANQVHALVLSVRAGEAR